MNIREEFDELIGLFADSIKEEEMIDMAKFRDGLNPKERVNLSKIAFLEDRDAFLERIEGMEKLVETIANTSSNTTSIQKTVDWIFKAKDLLTKQDS